MSETAQLLNLLVGVSAGASGPKVAHTGTAKPDAEASDAFLALLALAGANADAGSNALGAPLKAKAAETPSKDLSTSAMKEGSGKSDDPAREEIPGQANAAVPAGEANTKAEPLVGLSSSTTQDDLAALLVPNESSETSKPSAVNSRVVVPDATHASEVALAAVQGTKIAAPAGLSNLPEAATTHAAALAGKVAAAPQAAAPSSVATENPEQIAADLASSAKAEALEAASETPKPAPTREAIVNASLTSVASALLGEKPTSATTANKNETSKTAPKPAEAPRAAGPAPQSAASGEVAPKAASEGTPQASAHARADDLAARVSSNTNLFSAHDHSANTDSASPSQTLAYTPAQNAHNTVPVIVLRSAQGAQGPALPQDRIALSIVRQLEAGVSRFEIRLDPPELGRIDVKMSLRADGHVSAQLTADRPETLELLQRDARVLQRALTDAGLSADSGSLSFGLRDRGGRHAFDQDDMPASIGAIEAEDDAPLPYGLPLMASLEPGRVDLRI